MLALFSGALWGPVVWSHGHVSLVCVACPLIIIELRLLLACQWERLTLRLADCEDWPCPHYTICFWELIPWRKIHLNRLWCLPKPLCGSAVHEANWAVFCCGLKLVWGMLVLGHLGRISHASLGQLLPVISLGLPGRNYKAICRWSLSLLTLQAHGRGHIVN